MGKTRQTGKLVSYNIISPDIINDMVGIGTTNPMSKLHVSGNAYVTDNLGIGVTDPLTKLHVSGNAYVTDNLGIGVTSPTAPLTVSGSLDGTAFESYELDDLSSATNGIRNTFIPKFNYDRVTIRNPFRLMITINGIVQSAFINSTDFVYQSNFLGSNNGYTIDSDNNIKFTESIPTGSDIIVRVLPVSNTPTRIKYYPFKPTDILLGY